MSESQKPNRMAALCDLQVFLCLRGVDPEPIIRAAHERSGGDPDAFESALIEEMEPHRLKAWAAVGLEPPPPPIYLFEDKKGPQDDHA